MRKYILTTLVMLLIPVISFAQQWVKVEKETIVRWRSADQSDTLKQNKLSAHGYIPVVEYALPVYDSDVQNITKKYEIKEGYVEVRYTVNDRELSDAKNRKNEKMKQRATNEISELISSTVSIEDVELILIKVKALLTTIANVKDISALKAVSYEK